MDNQASRQVKHFLTAQECDLLLVEPHNHRVNAAERAIQTFKDHFVSALATTDSEFPLQLWDRLMPQVETTLNLMRRSRIDPTKSAYEVLNGPYDWNRFSLAPPDARPSYMSHLPNADHGAAGASMPGTLALCWTTTTVAIILSRKQGHIASPDRPNYFHNTVKYRASPRGSI